jgi:hypothetical protein
MFSEGFLSIIAEKTPPSPVPQIPATALNKIIRSMVFS